MSHNEIGSKVVVIFEVKPKKEFRDEYLYLLQI